MPRSGRARSRASSRYGLSLWPYGLKVASALPVESGGLSPIQRGYHPHVAARGPYLRKLRDIELVLGLLPGAGDVQRPRGRDARLAGLDELGDGDVDDALAAGLGAGDAEQAVDLAAGTLARGPGELVAEAFLLPLTRSE